MARLGLRTESEPIILWIRLGRQLPIARRVQRDDRSESRPSIARRTSPRATSSPNCPLDAARVRSCHENRNCIAVRAYLVIRLPEVSAAGLVLWRLRRPPRQELRCGITEFCGELLLGIHDVVADEVLFAEAHWDIVSLVSRAEELRDEYVAAGWRDFDLAAADTIL